jgi:TM2 domain-containing membrane protein YozV
MDQNPINVYPPSQPPPVENKKMAAGLCALLVGVFGVHKFVLGYNTQGIIYLIVFVGIPILLIPVTFITCGLGAVLYFPYMVLPFIPMIEGIIYLTKSDEQFYEIYQKNKRPWF